MDRAIKAKKKIQLDQENSHDMFLWHRYDSMVKKAEIDMRNKLITASVALAVAAVPTISVAAPAAQALSIRTSSPVRVASAQRDQSKLGGSILIALLAAAAVVGGVAIASGNGSASN